MFGLTHITPRVRALPVNRSVLVLLVAAIVNSSCGGTVSPSTADSAALRGGISISSPDFANNAPVPRDFTCDGANRSPTLEWSSPPTQARSLALVVEDPDAPGGTFTHWLVYDIPPATRSILEGVAVGSALPDESKQGTNSFGAAGYGGPCPPSGLHHYHFKLYALDTLLGLPAGATVAQLQSSLGGHILASGELVGTYSR